MLSNASNETALHGCVLMVIYWISKRLHPLAKGKKHSIDAVVDRLIIKEGIHNRLADSLELALSISGGYAEVLCQAPGRSEMTDTFLFSEKAACHQCGTTYPEFTPSNFSFNSPNGACPECDGIGTRTVFDRELIVPNPELSLREGAVGPWANRQSVYFFEFLEAFAHRYHTDIDTPFKMLPEAFREALYYGSGKTTIQFSVDRDSGHHLYNKPFEGLVPQLQRRYRETQSAQIREELQQYMSHLPCTRCNGARLKPESLAVKIEKWAIHQVTALSIGQAVELFRALALDGQKALIAEKIVREIIERLEFLNDVGLSYLALDRAAHTLSGGESQRIRLADPNRCKTDWGALRVG